MGAYESISQQIDEIPLIDVHTHIDLEHPSARGLHDLLLYHMLVSELYSAGCPDASRLSEEPDAAEARTRVERALPYIEDIKYSSTYSVLKRILCDLYGFTGTITADTWKGLDRLIHERYKSGYAEGILDKAHIAAVNTEYCRTHSLRNDRFFYSLEWAFFTRSQYGIYDAPIMELEIAASQDTPEGPIPVTADKAQYPSRLRLTTVDSIDEAMNAYVSKIPFNKIVSLPTHFSTDIRYRDVTREEMAAALRDRENAGSRERDIYANYINNRYLDALNRMGERAAVAISVGAEPLRYETASRLSADTIYAIERLANRYSGLDFIIFNGCDYQDTTLAGVIRETQNVYAAGFWWHNFFPSSMETLIRGRLERIPLNKWFGYFSDAYCADWAYGKSRLVRDSFTRVLSDLVDRQYYTFDDAILIAKRLLYQNAKDYFNL